MAHQTLLVLEPIDKVVMRAFSSWLPVIGAFDAARPSCMKTYLLAGTSADTLQQGMDHRSKRLVIRSRWEVWPIMVNSRTSRMDRLSRGEFG